MFEHLHIFQLNVVRSEPHVKCFGGAANSPPQLSDLLHYLARVHFSVTWEPRVHLHPSAPVLCVTTLAQHINVDPRIQINKVPLQPILRRCLAFTTEDRTDEKPVRKKVIPHVDPW